MITKKSRNANFRKFLITTTSFFASFTDKKINMASVALIREIFTQPSPDDTDESHGRIPAAVNRLGTVLNGLGKRQTQI